MSERTLFFRGKISEPDATAVEGHEVEHAAISSDEEAPSKGDAVTVQRPKKSMPPRMIIRNLPFFQSNNRFAVDHNQGLKLMLLLRYDWYHLFLNMPTYRSLLVLLSVWTLGIVVYAGVYYHLDQRDTKNECQLGPNGVPLLFKGAFAFSLQTCTTVGYTIPSGSNAFFEHCPGLQAAIFIQMVWSMLFNAFFLSFLYSRLARSESRAHQVLFAKHAIVSMVEGQVCFQVRVYDTNASHPVVESHVRLYVLAREQPVPRMLRLLNPNDELGGMLLLSVPTVVYHHIDVYSVLHPPVENYLVRPAGLGIRQVDATTNNRDDFPCPVCGESYGTHERWVNHVRLNQQLERKCKWPIEGTHLALFEDDLKMSDYPIKDFNQLRDFFEQEISEVVCVVEGIDPLTSGTFLALQSYRFDEIVWDACAQFEPCLDIDGESIAVDLDRFHGTTSRRNSFRTIETFKRKSEHD